MSKSQITIPAGSTTGSFTIFSEPVNSQQIVTVQANFLGSFQNANLTVVPWLTDFSLSPISVAGGNPVTGTVSIFAPAPAGGLPVQLGSSTPNLFSFPNGSTVTIPAGQSSFSFPISTVGVANHVVGSISATVAGRSITKTVGLVPARLATLTFNPSPAADGSTTTGTVGLNGLAGSNITVTITGLNGASLPAGFTAVPSTVTIPAGSKSATFNLSVPYESVNTGVTVEAHMSANQGPNTGYTDNFVRAQLVVNSFALKSFTVDMASLTAGERKWNVTIVQPAPTGGITLNISSSDPSVLSVPSSVTVPAGASSITFPIQAGYPSTDSSAIITVSRIPM